LAPSVSRWHRMHLSLCTAEIICLSLPGNSFC
jgi:hypothetical protein